MQPRSATFRIVMVRDYLDSDMQYRVNQHDHGASTFFLCFLLVFYCNHHQRVVNCFYHIYNIWHSQVT